MIYKLALKKTPMRAKEAKAYYGFTIKSPSDLYDLVRKLLKGEAQEVFLTFCLNVRLEVIGYVEVARGGIDYCLVDPKVVFGAALLSGAPNIILVHNHPSGDPSPSPDDIALTRRIKNGAQILGLTLVDHIIVAADLFESLSANGVMEKLALE
jgi:DNA repair protein RadC